MFTAAILFAGAAQAQTPPSPSQERPPLGAWITVDAIGRLPASASIFPLLSTVAEVIPDRIDTGGLSAGSPAREGAHGETWTQTVYHAGDADITNLSGTGTPLLMPGVDVWERIDVATGMMPIDAGAPGMSVALTPLRPAASLMRAIELFGSPPLFNAGSATTVPPTISRLNSQARANLFLSGPLVDRVSGLLSANWIRSSYSERDSNDALTGSLAVPLRQRDHRAQGRRRSPADRLGPAHRRRDSASRRLQQRDRQSALDRAAPAGGMAAPAGRRCRAAPVRLVHARPIDRAIWWRRP